MLAETLRGLFAGTFTQIRINAFLQAFLCDYGGILCLVVDVESASASRTRYAQAHTHSHRARPRCKLINFTLNIINELIDTIVLTVSIESIDTTKSIKSLIINK